MNKKAEDITVHSGNDGESYKFANDIIWFSVAQLFVSLILGIVTLPALTKSYIPAIYGIWIQLSVTVDLISPLLSLQLGLAVVRFLAGEDEEKRRRALGAMLFAIIVFAGIVSVAGLIFSTQLSNLLFASPEFVNYVQFLIVWTFFSATFNFFVSYLRVRGKIKQISVIQVVIVALKMISILGLSRAGFSLEAIVVAMIILYASFSLGILVTISREIGFPMPNISRLGSFLAFSIPQMPVITILWVISLSDRYFITHFLGLSQTGIYSSSGTLANLTSVFYMPISFVLFPLLSKLWKEERSEEVKSYFEYSIRLFLTLAIPGAIGIAILSQPLLRLLTTSEFLVGESLVLLLAFGAVFLGIYQININLILLGKQAKFLPVVTTAASVTSVVMNIILIPRMGIMGAAVSNCISYFTLATITTLWTRRILSYEYDFKYYGKVVMSSLVMMVCLYFLKFNASWGLVIDIIAGTIIFLAGLFLFNALSSQDKQLIRKTLGRWVQGNLKNRQ